MSPMEREIGVGSFAAEHDSKHADCVIGQFRAFFKTRPR